MRVKSHSGMEISDVRPMQTAYVCPACYRLTCGHRHLKSEEMTFELHRLYKGITPDGYDGLFYEEELYIDASAT